MDSCKQIKVIIDEAERPEAIGYNASRHIAACNDCSQFADERAKLKALLGDVGRVSAPPDFDFKLKARLAEVKGRKSSRWFTPAGYLRLGGATAALVIAVVAAQTSGLFSGEIPAENPADRLAQTLPITPASPAVTTPTPIPPVESGIETAHGTVARGSRNNRRLVRSASEPVREYVSQDRTTVLMRGPAGELEVPVPTVSVGAQSLMYVHSGRHQARAVTTSF